MSGKQQGTGQFTGRHMAIIMAAGFGVVIAVNLVMASLAVGGFHGVVVDNSYVASQRFNGWLANAEKARALGWEVTPERSGDGHVVLRAAGVPEGTQFVASLRRPLGDKAHAELTFRQTGQGIWRSNQPIAAGRWLIRVSADAGAVTWAEERELP